MFHTEFLSWGGSKVDPRLVHGFAQISLRTHNSSLEGAMKLKLIFVLFCSP